MSYETLSATATRLIRKYGKDAVVKTVTTTSVRPGNPVQSTESHDVKIVTVPVEQKYLGGDVLITDSQAYIPMTGRALTAKDLIVIGNSTYRIIELIPVEPGNIVVFYIAFLRK